MLAVPVVTLHNLGGLSCAALKLTVVAISAERALLLIAEPGGTAVVPSGARVLVRVSGSCGAVVALGTCLVGGRVRSVTVATLRALDARALPRVGLVGTDIASKLGDRARRTVETLRALDWVLGSGTSRAVVTRLTNVAPARVQGISRVGHVGTARTVETRGTLIAIRLCSSALRL